ncbi:MAG: ribose 5-phosphate isomerase B [Bacilli bacterium]|nr:ribose 5-phosphate isomerase B [Bacilli bacterium]
MKIAIGCDHGGYELKEQLRRYLSNNGHEVIDCGTDSVESVHYPVFAKMVAKNVLNGKAERGILICTTGEGVSMTANRFKGIRCGLCYNDEVARLMRAHNDANIIAFGARFTPLEDAIKRVEIFLNTKFEGGRHQTRVEMLDED